jgi:AraC-like DNA-binding protein
MVWLWAGGLLFVGPSLRLDRHSAAVPCLMVGLDRELTITVDTASTVSARSVLIPPRLPHHLDSGGGRIASCYLDPASAAAAACRRSMCGTHHRVATTHTAQDELIAVGGVLGQESLPGTAAHWLALAAPDDPATGRDGSRVHRILASIVEDPARDWRAVECARLAGLSESAFLRLVVAETRTSFRRYRLWARMLRAVRLVGAGRNLTEAGAEAGFATPSHLSSAFHALFGLPPSRLLASGITIMDLAGAA